MYFKLLILLIISCETVFAAKTNSKVETKEQYRIELRHGPPKIVRKTKAGQAQWGWFSPKLDHFNDNDQTRWPMRFTYNLQFARANGPIFIFVGGEWTIDTNSIEGGHIWDMARENEGSLWYTEHRFYGNSTPRPDKSTNNLRYLHSFQAMRDNVEFIRWLKSSPSYQYSRVVLVGCSYSASLVTWLKELYPVDVYASYASSGPLLAIDNFDQYFEVVGTVIKNENSTCWSFLRTAFNQLEESYNQDQGAAVRKLFKTCNLTVANPKFDRMIFFNVIANDFAGLVQYALSGDINNTCNYLMSRPGKNESEKLANYITRDLDGRCLSADYSAEVNYYKNIESDRPWTYQTCNEFGFFQTSRSQQNQPFGDSFSNTSYFHQLCRDAYNAGFSDSYIAEAQATTNRYYGGLERIIEQVVTVHGTNDPWTSLGLTQSTGEYNNPVFMVEGASHCQDLNSVQSTDSDTLRDAKNGVRSIVNAWLQQ